MEAKTAVKSLLFHTNDINQKKVITHKLDIAADDDDNDTVYYHNRQQQRRR